jgi:hypothetical protein
MRIMRKFLGVLLVVAVLFLGMTRITHAVSLVNLDVKNNGELIYSGTIPLSPTPSEDNVLSVIKQADALSADFNISNIVHYSFGDYLKCITISGTNELCDNWLYKVNGNDPAEGMGSYILSGGENILLYFGDDVTTTENATTGGGPLTTGYVPPLTLKSPTPNPTISLYSPLPTHITAVLPTPPTPESKPVISPLPSTISSFPNVAKTPETKQETKNLASIAKPKEKEKNLSTTEKVQTATIINALSDTTTQTSPAKKNWFTRLLQNIFGF